MTPWEKVSEGWAGLVARVQVVESAIESIKAVSLSELLKPVAQQVERLTQESRYWADKISQMWAHVHDLLGRVTRLEAQGWVKLVEQVSYLTNRLATLEARAVNESTACLDVAVVLADIKRLHGRMDAVSNIANNVANGVQKFYAQHEALEKDGAIVKAIIQGRLTTLEADNQDHRSFDYGLRQLYEDLRVDVNKLQANATPQEIARLNQWVTALARDLSKLEGRVSAKVWEVSPRNQPANQYQPISEQGIQDYNRKAAAIRSDHEAQRARSSMEMPDEARSTVREANQRAMNASPAGLGTLAQVQERCYIPVERAGPIEYTDRYGQRWRLTPTGQRDANPFTIKKVG
jgi:hypothetical protein